MGRNPKRYATERDTISRFIKRGENQELSHQTKLKHYLKTKDSSVRCALCNAEQCKLHRHRVVPFSEYTDEGTIIVCVPCHKLIHRIYKETNAQNEEQYQLAILIAKLEVNT